MRKYKFEKIYNVQLITVICSFIIGIFSGSVFANLLATEQISELKSYINELFVFLRMGDIESSELLKISLLQHLRVITIIWILGLFIFGAIFIYIYIFLKGFEYGFTTAFITKQFGFKGLLFSFFGFLPQNIIFIPTLIILSVLSVRYCLNQKRKLDFNTKSRSYEEGMSTKLGTYFSYFIVASILIIACSAVEAYVTPFLLQWFMK